MRTFEHEKISAHPLCRIIGYKGRVTEILSKKRKLTLEMIRKLHEKLNIPLELLVKAY